MSIEAIKFQHIEYFNEFIYKLQRDAYKINQDKITLKGITKINGTNVSVVFDNDEVRLQGRNLLLEKEEKYEDALSYVLKGLALEDVSAMKQLMLKKVTLYEKTVDYNKAYEAAVEYTKLYPEDKKMAREVVFLSTRKTK